MKKLKIFLLLSILLCFGFVLSSEVHAQGDGPKIFEVGDILPATTRLQIVWDIRAKEGESSSIKTTSDYLRITAYSDDDDNVYMGIRINSVSIVNTSNDEGSQIIDTSSWSEAQRTVTECILSSYMDNITWEDLNTPQGFNITFEENGGSTVTDLTEQTALPNPLPIPTKENHTFLGWYYNSAFTQIANAGDIIESDVTLYAMWRSVNAKNFEEDDVLPVGNIKISWDFTGKPIGEDDTFTISSDGDLFIEIWEFNNIELYINYEEFDAEIPSYTIITLTEPVTITDVAGNFNDYDVYIGDALLWEALPPEYLGGYDNVYDGERLEIEEGTILPAAKIGINLLFNNTGGSKSGTITYTFGTWAQLILTAQEDNYSTQVTSAVITFNLTNPNWEVYVIDDTLANQSFGSTRGILFAAYLSDFSWATEEERTITDITIEGDLEIDAIFTRILTEEELAYQEGYTDGYTTAREIFGWKDGDDWYNGIDAWNLGEKYARELYGYYDSTTDEWLTVSEYIARYGTGGGTGPTGPNDFYNNFDKYFIPAMIIVFGGAIVLTILKVFKGRE